MRTIIRNIVLFHIIFAIFLIPTVSFARATLVSGYFKSNGTYVAPYIRGGGSSQKAICAPIKANLPAIINDDVVIVKSYKRKDGIIVREHVRSKPDKILWNNFGQASSKQRKEWENLTVLPSSRNDSDNDGIPNREDMDDNNNGIVDDLDQKSNRVYSKKEMESSVNPLGKNCEFYF